jgi:hypothetical protein
MDHLLMMVHFKDITMTNLLLLGEKCISFTILSIVLSLQGCTNSELSGIPTIKVPKESEEILLKNFIKSIKYIPLETKEGSYISSILELKIINGNFLIRDVSGRVLIFDSEGKFIRMLGKMGDGPREYSRAYSIETNEEEELIYLGSVRKIQIYSKDFEFIKEKNLPFFVSYLSVLNGELLIITKKDGAKMNSGASKETFLYKMNKSLELIDSTLFRIEQIIDRKTIGFTTKLYVSQNQTGAYLYTPVLIDEEYLRDTLYQIVDDFISPVLKLEFEGPKFSSDGTKNINIYNIIISSTYLFCQYDRENKRMLFFYDMIKKTGINITKGLLDENGDPHMLKPIDLSKNLFYFYSQTQFTNSAEEELNPTLIIVELN